MSISRRAFLRMLVTGGATFLASCAPPLLPHATAPGHPATEPASPSTTKPPNHPAAGAQPPTPPGTQPPNQLTTEPTPTLSPSALIKNVIIFIQENHTFDSLFAGFPGADSEYAGQDCPDSLPADPPHQHFDSFLPGAATTPFARCSYKEPTAPNYWKLAREFTLCDRFFTDVRGPSHPNYFMLMAAQSPIVNTPHPTDLCPDFCFDLPTLPDRLDDAGLAWRDYAGLFTDIKGLVGRKEITADGDDASFFRDAAQGTLASVSWLNSNFLSDGDNKSGHPPASLCRAENYMVQVVNAVMASPQWSHTALFLVWDDWGGFFDHVEPPVVERWTDGTPFRYGFRVPLVVVSPYARSGYVSHTFSSHVSLLRFPETIFGLPPLTDRDAAANDLLDCFDFSQPPQAPFQMMPRNCQPG